MMALCRVWKVSSMKVATTVLVTCAASSGSWLEKPIWMRRLEVSRFTLSRARKPPRAAFSVAVSCSASEGAGGARSGLVFGIASQLGVAVKVHLANDVDGKVVGLQHLGFGFQILGVTGGGGTIERKYFAGRVNFNSRRGFEVGVVK